MNINTKKTWTVHTGIDYTVVLLPDETTENASIRVYGDDACEVAYLLAAAPQLLEVLIEVRDALAIHETSALDKDRCVENATRCIAKATYGAWKSESWETS
jgi:hypothetical protein